MGRHGEACHAVEHKKRGAEKQPFHLSYAAKNYFGCIDNKKLAKPFQQSNKTLPASEQEQKGDNEGGAQEENRVFLFAVIKRCVRLGDHCAFKSSGESR